MKISVASKTELDAVQLATFADSIRLSRHDNGDGMDKEMLRLIDNLPSRQAILTTMDDAELSLLQRSVGYIWRKLTGKSIQTMDMSANPSSKTLDGCYWMLPGGVMLHGLNHFSTAKDHRDIICSILGINPFIFEHKLSSDPEGLVGLVVSHGGVRVLADRNKSSVYMQVNEKSWPWARDKAQRMYHKNKVIKILDLSQPYLGWESGVSVIIKRPRS